MKYTLYLSQLLVPRTLAEFSYIHAICVVPHGQVAYHILSPSSYAPRARTALSHEFPLDTARGAAE